MPTRKYSALARWVHLPPLKVRNIDVSNEYIDNNLRRLGPHQWIGLRYEVVCREPEKTLSRLAGFACVEPSEVLMMASEKRNTL
jgi:hypothetical protein